VLACFAFFFKVKLTSVERQRRLVLVSVIANGNALPRQNRRWKKATSTSLGSIEARAGTTLQVVLPNAGRGARRRGTWLTVIRITVAMRMEAEANKAGYTTAAAVAEGSAREIFRVGVCS
jgi:hypothetical protein